MDCTFRHGCLTPAWRTLPGATDWHLGTALDGGGPVTLDDGAMLGNVIVRHDRDTALAGTAWHLVAQAAARGLGVVHVTVADPARDQADALVDVAGICGRSDDVVKLDWRLVGRPCPEDPPGHGWDPFALGTAPELAAALSDAVPPDDDGAARLRMLGAVLGVQVHRRDADGVRITLEGLLRDLHRKGLEDLLSTAAGAPPDVRGALARYLAEFVAAGDEGPLRHRLQDVAWSLGHVFDLLATHLGLMHPGRLDVDLVDLVENRRLLHLALPDTWGDVDGTTSKAGFFLGCLGIALARCRPLDGIGTLLVVDLGPIGMLPAMSRIAHRAARAGVGMVAVSREGGNGRTLADSWEAPGPGSAFETRVMSRLRFGHPALVDVGARMRDMGIPADMGPKGLADPRFPSSDAVLLRAGGSMERYQATPVAAGMPAGRAEDCLLSVAGGPVARTDGEGVDA